jgi:hypothetical protein
MFSRDKGLARRPRHWPCTSRHEPTGASHLSIITHLAHIHTPRARLDLPVFMGVLEWGAHAATDHTSKSNQQYPTPQLKKHNQHKATPVGYVPQVRCVVTNKLIVVIDPPHGEPTQLRRRSHSSLFRSRGCTSNKFNEDGDQMRLQGALRAAKLAK